MAQERRTALDRRQVLAALGLAASSPVFARPAAAPKRVAIIGGGMAGVACAWLLDGQAQVLLLEARNDLGGNVQTVDLVLDGRPLKVDIGAQFFHPGPYPTYVQLLTQLGLYPPVSGGSHAFDASITVFDASESTPRFVSPLLPGRAWPLLAPWNHDGVQAFRVAFDAAERREMLGVPWRQTLGDWLPTLGLSPLQWEGMILPWAASIFSGDIEQARSLSARSAMIFAAKALPPKPTDPTVYYVLEQGLIEALRRMAAQFTSVQVQTGSPVSSVTRLDGGSFSVQTAAGQVAEVDDVVFAASGAPTLALLQGLSGTERQRQALQGIEFFEATLMLHTDPVYATADARYRSFLNCRAQSGFCEASMWLAPVLSGAPDLWKSWVTHRSQLPSQVLHQAGFRHLLTTPSTIRAQDALGQQQGRDGIWFAGGWTQPYDSQETALLSAMNVAEALAPGARRVRPTT
jgi:predicted NAD/FAD-binding protein